MVRRSPMPSRPHTRTGVVIYVGNSFIHETKRVEDLRNGYQFIALAGRAIVIPVLFGTLERGPSQLVLPAIVCREGASDGKPGSGAKPEMVHGNEPIPRLPGNEG